MRMPVSIIIPFSEKGNDFLFTYYLSRTTDEIDNPWCLSFNSDYLGVSHYNF